jgi:hypothetical protein
VIWTATLTKTGAVRYRGAAWTNPRRSPAPIAEAPGKYQFLSITCPARRLLNRSRSNVRGVAAPARCAKTRHKCLLTHEHSAQTVTLPILSALDPGIMRWPNRRTDVHPRCIRQAVKESVRTAFRESTQGRRREEVSPWRPKIGATRAAENGATVAENERDLRLVRRSNGKPLHQERRSGATFSEGDYEAARSLEGWSGRLGAFLPF